MIIRSFTTKYFFFGRTTKNVFEYKILYKIFFKKKFIYNFLGNTSLINTIFFFGVTM